MHGLRVNRTAVEESRGEVDPFLFLSLSLFAKTICWVERLLSTGSRCIPTRVYYRSGQRQRKHTARGSHGNTSLPFNNKWRRGGKSESFGLW